MRIKNVIDKLWTCMESIRLKMHENTAMLSNYSFSQKIRHMISKIDLTFVLGILAFLGLVFGVRLVVSTGYQLPPGQPVITPPPSIYQNFIAAEGIIESNTNNIQLSTQAVGIVKDVHVKVGDIVNAGDLLFTLDQRVAQADMNLKNAQVEQAVTAVQEAHAQMVSAQNKFILAEQVKDRRAISQDDYNHRHDTFLIAQAAHEKSLKTMKVAQEHAKLSAINLELLNIRAPINCRVLQINVHPGEFASQSALTGSYKSSLQNTPLMLLGGVGAMHVRVNIDENEAWRLQPGAKAVAYLRGNSQLKLDMIFDHIEPFIVPKTSLTGSSSERVDTRVLQAIYKLENLKENMPVTIYLGQQVDVFIETNSIDSHMPMAHNPVKK